MKTPEDVHHKLFRHVGGTGERPHSFQFNAFFDLMTNTTKEQGRDLSETNKILVTATDFGTPGETGLTLRYTTKFKTSMAHVRGVEFSDKGLFTHNGDILRPLKGTVGKVSRKPLTAREKEDLRRVFGRKR